MFDECFKTLRAEYENHRKSAIEDMDKINPALSNVREINS